MRSVIPNGLRLALLVNFVVALVFGLAGTLAPKPVGDIAGHPVRDTDVNMLMGLAALAFAAGSWWARRTAVWEQMSIVVAMVAIFNLAAGVGGLIINFVPSLVSEKGFPPVQLLVSVVMLLLGLAFTYYYLSINGTTTPRRDKVSP